MALSVKNSLFGSRSCSDRHLFVCILSESGFTRFFDSQDSCPSTRSTLPRTTSSRKSFNPLNPDSDIHLGLNQDLPDSSILRITAHPHAVHYPEPHHPANPSALQDLPPNRGHPFLQRRYIVALKPTRHGRGMLSKTGRLKYTFVLHCNA